MLQRAIRVEDKGRVAVVQAIKRQKLIRVRDQSADFIIELLQV